jgi:GT2 family glycosyltransferase
LTSRRSSKARVIVIGNGWVDGTAAAVRERHPGVDLIELGANRGAAARNVGVARAGTPYVGLANDSWWAPGSLAPAADVLDSCPRVAVLAARVLVGESQRLDPHAPNADRSARHPDRSSRAGRVGFMACGAVVRRNAFLRCGGFDDIVFFVGEKERGARSGRRGLCTRLRASVVAHHHPSPVRVVDDRRPLAVRKCRPGSGGAPTPGSSAAG